jgi:starvation-inducible outer membrane lipoprotein
MKTLFLALVAIIAFNLMGCATTPPQKESAKPDKWQQEMGVIQPRGR